MSATSNKFAALASLNDDGSVQKNTSKKTSIKKCNSGRPSKFKEQTEKTQNDCKVKKEDYSTEFPIAKIPIVFSYHSVAEVSEPVKGYSTWKDVVTNSITTRFLKKLKVTTRMNENNWQRMMKVVAQARKLENLYVVNECNGLILSRPARTVHFLHNGNSCRYLKNHRKVLNVKEQPQTGNSHLAFEVNQNEPKRQFCANRNILTDFQDDHLGKLQLFLNSRKEGPNEMICHGIQHVEKLNMLVFHENHELQFVSEQRTWQLFTCFLAKGKNKQYWSGIGDI